MNKEETFKELRKKIVNESYTYNLTHISSALSVVDIFYTFFSTQNFKEFNLIDCKYFGVQALRVVCEKLNIPFKRDHVFVFKEDFKFLTYTIETLGDGLGIAAGICLGNQKPTYVFISDSQLQSGYFYEALNFIITHNLNVKILVDLNGVQVLGKIKENNSIDIILNQHIIQSFYCNGHNYEEIESVLEKLKIKKPQIVFFKTTKGKGIQSLENDPMRHYFHIDNLETLRKIEDEIETYNYYSNT